MVVVMAVAVVAGCSKEPTQPPAGPGTQGLPGHLAFSMRSPDNLEGTGEIYRQRADGSGLTRLTTNDVEECHPRWSPDGTKVAFLRSAGIGYDLYVMDENGGDVRRLTTDPLLVDCGSDNGHRWSPDGSRLLVMQYDYNRGWSWIILRLDGSSPDTVFAANDSIDIGIFGFVNPWAPDGQTIAYGTFSGSSPGVYVYTVASRSHRFVVADGHEPFWSSDGNRFFFENEGHQLWSVTLSGNDPRACATVGDFMFPSPDRGQVVYQNRTLNQELWIVDLASCTARALWPSAQDRPAHSEPIQWSRDGRHLLYWELLGPDSSRVRAVEVATGRVHVVFDEARSHERLGFVDWKP